MIKLCDVTVKFGEKVVLDAFSCELPKTGVIVVTGTSGRGKTTLLRLLAGLLKPNSGSISGLPQRTSVVFQEDRLLPWFSAKENVALIRDDGKHSYADAERWLRAVELDDSMELLPKELSGGMQRRVALARALNYGGDMLLLDEPFKGLDAALTTRVAGRMAGAFPLTVIATHEAAEAKLLGECVHIDL